MAAELRTLIRSVRALTAWLGEDVPITTDLRRELEIRGVRPAETLLLRWTQESGSSFAGALSPADGERVDFTYSWSARSRTGAIRAWKTGVSAAGAEGDALVRAAAQLRRYAAESRAERESRIDEAEAHLGCCLPADYRAFLVEHNGLLEWVSRETFLDLAPIYELVHANDIPQAATHPGLVVVGSDGGRGIIGFDCRSDPPPVVLVDNASAGWHEAVPQGRSFASFLRAVAASGLRYE